MVARCFFNEATNYEGSNMSETKPIDHIAALNLSTADAIMGGSYVIVPGSNERILVERTNWKPTDAELEKAADALDAIATPRTDPVTE